MKKMVTLTVFLLGSCLFVGGCPAPITNKTVEKALKEKGYSSISIYDKSVSLEKSRCGKKDTVVYECLARDPLDLNKWLIVCVNERLQDVTIFNGQD